MAILGGPWAQHLMRYVAWWTMALTAAACRFDLPMASGVDAPGIDAPRIDAPGVDASPPQVTSCVGLALTCGPSGTGDCCEPADPIGGGTFLRGYDAATDAFNDMNYPATISMFVLDKYEVTVGRFRRFVEAGLGTQASPPAPGAGAHPHPALASSGWDSTWNTNLAADTAALKAAVKCDSTHQTWTDAPEINENKPINCVTWYEAMAFCIWDGGYLPTEAEWNYAAAGGGEQRTYPWSNPASTLTLDCSYANYKVNNPAGTYCVNGTTGGVNRVGSESPTGDGRWKHSDLTGNVWEWTLDWYTTSYPEPQTCNDCANLTPGAWRVIRGSSFQSNTPRAAGRNQITPTIREGATGVRCARTP